MALATAARYTGSAVELALGAGLLALAALHAIAGVPSAILPAAGGLVLVGAALALAPITSVRRRWMRRQRSDAALFVGSLGLATLTLGAFVLTG